MPKPTTVSTCLWFDDQAEEAVNFYCSLFQDARIVRINHNRDDDGTPRDSVLVIAFELMGQRFTALNGGPHYKLTEAVSIEVQCDTQAEIDRYWSALADAGTELRCGWLTDRFGLTWQIVPRMLIESLSSDNPAQAARVLQAMMGMVKLDIAGLEAAAKG